VRFKETYSIWAIGRLDTGTIKEESNRLSRFPLALTEGIHELLELGGALDLEEDLVVIVCDFNVEVLADLGLFRLVGCARAAILIRLQSQGCNVN